MSKKRTGLHGKCNSVPFFIIVACYGELMTAVTKWGVRTLVIILLLLLAVRVVSR